MHSPFIIVIRANCQLLFSPSLHCHSCCRPYPVSEEAVRACCIDILLAHAEVADVRCSLDVLGENLGMWHDAVARAAMLAVLRHRLWRPTTTTKKRQQKTKKNKQKRRGKKIRLFVGAFMFFILLSFASNKKVRPSSFLITLKFSVFLFFFSSFLFFFPC